MITPEKWLPKSLPTLYVREANLLADVLQCTVQLQAIGQRPERVLRAAGADVVHHGLNLVEVAVSGAIEEMVGGELAG